MRTFRRLRPQDDRGSSLTEFALVAPIFGMLLFWSQFFTDIGIVKFKVEEAARFASWEMVAHRQKAQVQGEVVQNFADLSSVFAKNKPVGTRSFKDPATVKCTIDDQVSAPLGQPGDQIPNPGGGGLLGKIIGWVAGFFAKAVNWAVGKFDFNQKGAAEATVEFTVKNTLFPGGSILGMFLDSGTKATLTMKARSPAIVWDTWKAWPGKYQPGSTNVGTDPMATYPSAPGGSASPPEVVVKAHVSKIAYFGFMNGMLGSILNAPSYLGFPPLVPKSTWNDSKEKGGPIVMLQAEKPTGQVAGSPRSRLERFGDSYVDNVMKNINSPDPGVDRSRHTIPYKVETEWWKEQGGYTRSAVKLAKTNDYVKMMQCRDVFYMGSRKAQTTSFMAGYASTAFPGCK